MYIYDIVSQNKGQYALFMSYDGEYWGAPLNVAKKVYYLKNKMKAHRDEMVEYGYDDMVYYRIVDYDQNVVFTHCFQKGEKGGSNVSYHVESIKSKTVYKTAYLYDYTDEIILEEKEGVFPVTTFEVICDDDGNVKTDLKLLKLIGTFLYRERIPVIVSKKAQVALATYMPLSKETFIELPGCGEKMFLKCGDKLIELIKAYLFA